MLRARLRALRAAGIDRFDDGDVDFIEGLLEKGRQASPGVRARLEARARKHLFRLELRFEAERFQAKEAVHKARRHDRVAAEELKQQLDLGDLVTARRRANEAVRRAENPALKRARERLEKVVEAATGRPGIFGSTLTQARLLLKASAFDDPDLVKRIHRVANELSLRLIQEAADGHEAPLIVERLLEVSPTEAGPLNPESLVSNTLLEISRLSPGYVRALLGWTRDLMSLDQLSEPSDGPELTVAVKNAKGKKKKGGRKKATPRAKAPPSLATPAPEAAEPAKKTRSRSGAGSKRKPEVEASAARPAKATTRLRAAR